MDNNMKKDTKINNKLYTCGICGKTFSTIEERNVHEAKCIADCKKAEAALAKKRLEEEKNVRKTEIEKKYKELGELMKKYCKDYGSLQLGDYRYFEDDNFPNLSKLLGWWF